MEEKYLQAIKEGEVVYHEEYCLSKKHRLTAYDGGAIRLTEWDWTRETDISKITVYFANGETCSWETKYIDPYNIQFGVAVSFDGRYVFGQTWENGLFCFDSRTGERIWRTKSRRGITSMFVGRETILCHQRERALQLLDIHTGAVLAEKRPAAAWGFTALDHRHIICRVRARQWDIIEAATLETKESVSDIDFKNGNVELCVNKIVLRPGGIIRVGGFINVWDETVTPHRELPNINLEHEVESAYLKKLYRT